MSRHFDFFSDLRMIPRGQAQIVDRAKVLDIITHYWRDEHVSGPEEWFVKTGRGLGLDITYILERDYFVVRLDDRCRDDPGQATR